MSEDGTAGGSSAFSVLDRGEPLELLSSRGGCDTEEEHSVKQTVLSSGAELMV